jgi:hypothetical protein
LRSDHKQIASDGSTENPVDPEFARVLLTDWRAFLMEKTADGDEMQLTVVF